MSDLSDFKIEPGRAVLLTDKHANDNVPTVVVRVKYLDGETQRAKRRHWLDAGALRSQIELRLSLRGNIEQ